MAAKNSSAESLFWADQLAKKVVERAGKREAVVKSGASPSGAKHIGNLNDVLRAYFISRGVTDAGHKAKLIHTCDDRDPLKTIPTKLPDRKGNQIEVDEAMKKIIARDIGKPMCNAADPFGCCESWAKHFNGVWLDGIAMLGVKVENHYNSDLYDVGRFDEPIRMALSKVELSRKVLSKFQSHVDENYIPFNPVCEKCGRITATATSFDLEKFTVRYVCGGKKLKGKYDIEGCGHEGEASLRSGKLPWRFEWPAQWKIFGVDCEPFGKDHYQGSWPSGQEIARDIFGIEPPLYSVYDFFTVDGAKMSASVGNTYVTQDVLRVLEPEAFLYFYAKRPEMQRDFAFRDIFKVADEFERIERIYYGAEKAADKKEETNSRRIYECCTAPQKSAPVRMPYQFAAAIAQTTAPAQWLERAIKLLRFSGAMGSETIGRKEEERVEKRLRLAKFWADRYAPEESRIKIFDKTPAGVAAGLSAKQKAVLKKLAEALEEELDEKELYNKFYEIAAAEGVKAPELFRAAYMALLGRAEGPRLAPFIFAIGKEKAARIFSEL